MRLCNDIEAAKKRSKGICIAYGCTHETRRRKGRRQYEKLCDQHKVQGRKEKNPIVYWYGVLRRNAKRRNKVFTITLEYFTQFCNEHKYIERKGRNVGNMSIDRIIDELGYIPGNLQILEHGSNTRKRFVKYWQDQETMEQTVIYASMLDDPPPPPVVDEEPPF